MRITILTVGTRGDVQPYVALGAGLQCAGHRVRIPTTALFRDLVEGAGLEFVPVEAADPQQMIRRPEIQAAMREGGQVRVLGTVLRQAGPMMRGLIDGFWQASAGADLIISGTIPFGMLDFAEGRNIPAVYAPLHAMHPTRAFPSPFFAPLGPRLDSALNPLTYGLTRGIMWQVFRPEVNRWRQRAGLHAHSRNGYFRWMRARRIPVVCGFSRAVLPEPAEWPIHRRVTGYWFWDEPGWQPPAALEAFLAAGPPPVSIGFGSMDDQDPARLTSVAVQALNMAGQRGILIGGWGGLGRGDLPGNVFPVEAVPHSWLFPRVAAVVHHGGMGTTAAGLRAGVPAVITPVGGDQPFWAARLAQLGVGIQGEGFSRLNAAGLAGHIRQAVTDGAMRERAATLGRRIRAEDGVGHAVRLINRWVERTTAQGMGIRD